MFVPKEVCKYIDGMTVSQSDVGCTQAKVYRFSDNKGNVLYLKIDKADEVFRRERDVLLWLDGKVPVPQVKCWHERDGFAYLLMTEAQGHMCCCGETDTVRKPVESTIKLLADGLLALQGIDTSDCPFDNNLENKLKQALYNIENNLVDMDGWESNNNFDSPVTLYNWLDKNRPKEDLCFSHGDYCLPNIFIDDTKISGFIDVGRGGIADKYQDIALCVRSIGYNLREFEQAERDKHITLLFSHLEITPDWNKINYYILLDELF